ncbi:MAG: RnfABCDGE type electron transport complex subunit B [bacterium]|nr:RnfABCDGE type electron transport complex subunit B [bacterium]
MDSFLSAVIGLGVMGLVFGVLIAIADEKLKIQVNQLEEQVLAALPGANCGACGYPGCSGYAHVVAYGDAPPGKCVAGGEAVAEKLSKLLGVEVKAGEKKIAYIKCQGGEGKASNIFQYDGFPDCQTAILVSGGHKACQYGCLGFGTCSRVCPFKAIKMNALTKLPEIDEKLCTACGICVTECPKKIIELIQKKNKVEIRCSSLDKGIEVKKKCTIGCIACQICVKKCPENAITMENNLAKIDYNKCTNCLQCVSVCPTKTIYNSVPQNT